MATRRWRPLAVASVVTATLAGAVVLRAVLGGGDDEPPATTDPTATLPSPATAPAASATAEAPLTRVESPLRKRTFAPGEQIEVKTGIGFLSADSGALETWSPVDEAAYPFLGSTPDGALISYYPPPAGSPGYLVERSTGNAYRVATNLRLIEPSAHGLAMVVAVRNGDREDAAILQVASGSVTPLGLSGTTGQVGAAGSPDGRRVALVAGTTVALVDLASGGVTRLAEVQTGAEAVIARLPGALGFSVTEAGRPRRWFSWEGAEVERELPGGTLSPNGRYVARGVSPGRIKSFGMGGHPSIDSVVIEERSTGKAAAAFLSAGVATGQPWSVNSDTLVVEVAEGYRVVNLAGETLRTIEDPSHALQPQPSPAFNGLFGTGRGTIINIARGTVIAPRYAVEPWFANWNLRPGELVVQLATPGKGRSFPVQVLPFEARVPAPSSFDRVRVAAGGDCLNFHEKPGTGSPVVACVSDGAVATLTAVDDPEYDPKTAKEPAAKVIGVAPDGSDAVWLHLSAQTGPAGWVDSRYVGWAR